MQENNSNIFGGQCEIRAKILLTKQYKCKLIPTLRMEFWLTASNEGLSGIDEYSNLQGYDIMWTEEIKDISEYLLPICRLWAICYS
jgi:hypothetical protein